MLTMYVTVTGSTARASRVRRVADIEPDETATAGKVATDTDGLLESESAGGFVRERVEMNAHVTADGSNSNSIVEFMVDNNVVRTSDGQLIPVASKIILGKSGRALWVKIEDLIHVEELDAVVNSLRSDYHQIVDNANLPPPGTLVIVLGQTAEVGHLAFAGDFGERGTIVLPDGDKLAA